MTDARVEHRYATIHLTQQATVELSAGELWPMHGDYARFGADLPSFAQEVTRRLRADGYIGFSRGANQISVVPLSSIKRIDFTLRS